MQEIDEAIQKAEHASLTMQKVKVQEDMIQVDMNSDLESSPGKVRAQPFLFGCYE